MRSRPMRTCRLAFAVPVKPNAGAAQDDGDGVEWREVKCYATEDESLVVHRNADDPRVYSLSHAPTGRSIPLEATGSPDPLIELANRLSGMTDWAQVDARAGIDELSPRVRRRIFAELDRFNRWARLGPSGAGAAADGV